MRIRDYHERDAPEITRLFYEAVRAVNRADYSPEQIEAWAPKIPDPAAWHVRMSSRCTILAEEEGGEVVGFAELEEDGHLDMLYRRKDFAGRGAVGSLLYQAVEQKARERKLRRIFTEASSTARSFFERHGFYVVREQRVVRWGVELKNFAMEKPLRPGAER